MAKLILRNWPSNTQKIRGLVPRVEILVFFRRGELAPEYEATALGLRLGEISDPVETQFGFHMIQLLEIKGTSFNTRHILRIPKASEADIQRAERYLDSLKREIEAGKIDFANAAKEYSDDRATSDNGGFFVDPTTNSKRLSLRTLEDPILYFTIDTMEVGSITKPIRFEDPREGVKVRILYYQAKYPAHRANLEDDYEKNESRHTSKKKKTRSLKSGLLRQRKMCLLTSIRYTIGVIHSPVNKKKPQKS